MVNQVLLEYLKKNLGKYSSDVLREKILSSGYSLEDFEDAKNSLEKKKSNIPPIPTSPNKKGGFMWIRFASFLGIFLFCISLIGFVVNSFWAEEISKLLDENTPLLVFSLIFFGLVFLLSLFYLYGFSRVARYTESKLLRFSSIAQIFSSVFLIFLFILLISFGNSSPIEQNSIYGMGLLSQAFLSIPLWIKIVSILILVSVVFLLVLRALFSISLIRIRSLVKFSLIAGILDLILMVTGTLILFIFLYFLSVLNSANPFSILASPSFLFFVEHGAKINIGITILGLIALLFEVLVLFKASKKYEL
jgi:hypothetical protein